ncbi:hypothetical protein H2200_001296 [Cladophialophora chaetospira]|uniref:Fumarylacetoacetase-like C-terminal domain-containing protein n=1 Tax=Cladophialophora chaetospira TaxID=386627 RepID=A0AA38XKL4_9EURO|nr:hypothetical protein H2200_001296 [Cladophialophora chaetospira]
MAAVFEYLVRFVDEDGNIVYGNMSEPKTVEDLVGTQLPLLTGDPYNGFKLANKSAVVQKFKVPSQPVVFPKPADAIAGPSDDVYCHPDARSQLDYEGELCFIFGRDCKDVKENEAFDYVLGYTIGNDISARNYIPQEVSGGQMGYGKSFDGFAPFGPYIVSKEVVGDPHNLQLVTSVNGEIRQNENTSDMVWNIKQIIAHLTRGRTVRAGTVCMTGTPSGVGWFMHPEGFVRDGDIMEVSIERLGTLKNRIVY